MDKISCVQSTCSNCNLISYTDEDALHEQNQSTSTMASWNYLTNSQDGIFHNYYRLQKYPTILHDKRIVLLETRFLMSIDSHPHTSQNCFDQNWTLFLNHNLRKKRLFMVDRLFQHFTHMQGRSSLFFMGNTRKFMTPQSLSESYVAVLHTGQFDRKSITIRFS